MIDIHLTEYDRELLLVVLENYVSEYGSSSWKIDDKNSVKNILQQLKAEGELRTYIGGILK